MKTQAEAVTEVLDFYKAHCKERDSEVVDAVTAVLTELEAEEEEESDDEDEADE